MYCRVDLDKTNYKEIDYKLLDESYFDKISNIYKKYIDYKKFSSAIPIFIEDLQQTNTEILGYFDKEELIAFSIVLVYPSRRMVYADQFAWGYENPKLKLGYESLRSECARYKRLGFKYFYLGEYNEYKNELKGFEEAPSSDV